MTVAESGGTEVELDELDDELELELAELDTEELELDIELDELEVELELDAELDKLELEVELVTELDELDDEIDNELEELDTLELEIELTELDELDMTLDIELDELDTGIEMELDVPLDSELAELDAELDSALELLLELKLDITLASELDTALGAELLDNATSRPLQPASDNDSTAKTGGHRSNQERLAILACGARETFEDARLITSVSQRGNLEFLKPRSIVLISGIVIDDRNIRGAALPLCSPKPSDSDRKI